jgi:galactonate dehydratase
MQVTRLDLRLVRVNERGDWLFVQVHTDAGLTGIGEASHGGSGPARDRVVAAIVREQIAPLLVGRDPRAVRAAVAALRPVASGLPGWTAVSAVEQALWDLAGQAAGLPVYRLLGGPARERIPLYANINRATRDRTPAGFAASARAAAAQGFGAIKCAPFDGVDPLSGRDRAGRALVAAGLARVAAIRDALGPTPDLYVDCHGRFDVATAVWVARELATLGVRWFEEPVPTEDRAALAQVRDRVAVEVIGGEHLLGPAACWPYLADHLFGTLMPDVKHCGGIGGLVAIGELAAAAGVAVAPHNPSGPVALAASLQAAAVLPSLRILEYAWGEVDWRAGLVTPAEAIVAGELALPTAPGLGVRLDEAAVGAHGGALAGPS